jgi:predicted DNA-binding protein with PD1-like motif
VVARLVPGSDLLASLLEIARTEGIRAGVILSGAASLSQVVLRNMGRLPPELPVTDADRLFIRKDGPYELLALSGNIAEVEGEPFVHAHITVSAGEEQGLAYGGHLLPGCTVYSLAELVIAEIEGLALTRPYDASTRGPQLTVTPQAAPEEQTGQ